MNFFKRIAFANKILKAIKEVKAVYESNSATADKIKEIIDDLINILNKIKEVVPAVDEAITAIIDVIKKWFKK